MKDIDDIPITEDDVAHSLCLCSFFDFVVEFWDTVIPEKPVFNWHIKYLCDMFQEDAERVFRGEPKLYDTIVNIPPGTTKSTILSIMAPAWIHARRPDMRVLCASHTQKLTFEFGRKCRMIEESPKYRRLFPDTIPSPDQWEKSFFMLTAGGGRIGATVGGQSPTGFHAHFILVDDPLDPQQAKKTSEIEINTANDFMTETVSTRKVNKEITVTWLIMQRLHQNDPSGFLLNRTGKEIRHICLPAEKSSKVRPLSVRKYYKNGLLDPVRLSERALAEAKVDLGEFGYSGQYRQAPVPRGGGMFKVTRLIQDTPPPLSSRGWTLCRAWDKAGTEGAGAYTVGFLMGRYRAYGCPVDGSEDQWWILDVVRVQQDSGTREKTIKMVAIMDGKKTEIGIEQEPGAGGKESAQATMKRLAGYKVRLVPAIGTKEDRADSWSVMVNQGEFRIAPGEWNRALIDELQYFPYSRYKDQTDAGALAYTILSEPILVVGAN